MRIFQPLRDRPVALLWGGLSLSALGDQLYAVALTWIAVGVLGSNAGYLGALQALVALVAVLGVGRWADRWEQLRGMIGADLARAAVLVAVVASSSMTVGPGVAQLAGAIVVLAIGQAVFQPALQSVLPSLVRDERLLPAANGLLDGTARGARLLGPGLVALLAGIVPVIHFLTVDALSFLASAAALLAIRRGRSAAVSAASRPIDRESIWRGIVRGFRATAAHRLLNYSLMTCGVINGVWYAVFYLALPLMIARNGGGSREATELSAYGMVLSAYGFTNLGGNLVFGSRTLPSRPQFQMYGGLLLGGCGIVLLGLASFLPFQWRVPGFMAAAGLVALGGPMSDIPIAVLRQLRLKRADMAAAMRAYMAMSNAGTLLGMGLAPVALALMGVVPVIVACGVVFLGVAATGLVRNAGWEEAAADPA